MKIFIYSYRNKKTNSRYIGKTNNIERRKREHLSAAYNKDSTTYNTMWSKKNKRVWNRCFRVWDLRSHKWKRLERQRDLLDWKI